MMPPTTENDLLGGAVRICQPARGYRVTSDAVLLAALTPVQPGQRVLDLGTGYGQVALCLLAREPSLQVTGLELMEAAAELARHNRDLNHRADNFSVQIGDVATFNGAGGYEVVVSNPPYRTAQTHTASADPLKAAATVLRQPLAVWVACAGRALTPGGAVIFILDSRQQTEALDAFMANGFVRLQAQPLTARDGEAPTRTVILAQRGSPQTLCRAPLVMHEADGSWRGEIKAVLRKPLPLSF